MKASSPHWWKINLCNSSQALPRASFPAFSASSKRLLLSFQSSAYSLSSPYNKKKLSFLYIKRPPAGIHMGGTLKEKLACVTCAAVMTVTQYSADSSSVWYFCCDTILPKDRNFCVLWWLWWRTLLCTLLWVHTWWLWRLLSKPIQWHLVSYGCGHCHPWRGCSHSGDHSGLLSTDVQWPPPSKGMNGVKPRRAS